MKLKKSGFTLLEILIALAIFSVIIAALYSTFFLSNRAVEAVDDSLLRLQESRALLDVIKREMESAYYRIDRDYPPGFQLVFKLEDRDFYGKQASRITFTCFSPTLNGLATISYDVAENDGKLSLRKQVAPAFSKSSKTEPVEVMEDVESFTIEAKYNDKWVKTWDSDLTKNIPGEIRISLTIRRGKEHTQEGLTISDIAIPKIRTTL